MKDGHIEIHECIVGVKDHHGQTITAVYSTSAAHVIYEVDAPISDSCNTLFLDDTDPAGYTKYWANYNLIRPTLDKLKRVLYKCGNDASVRSIRGSLIAHGLNNPEDAKIQLQHLIDSINTNYKEIFEKRILYLGSAFLILILFCLTSAFIKYQSIEGTIDVKFKSLVLTLYVATGGVIGGFISVSYRLKNLTFEKEVDNFYFFIYGTERLVISILASIVLFMSIKSNFVFGALGSSTNATYGYILLGVVAGFSETLIPNLMEKMEKQGLQSKDEVKSK